MNYHLDGHGLHGSLLSSAAQKASRRHDWKLMLYCMALLGRSGQWKYVMKKLLLYLVEDSNVFIEPNLRDEIFEEIQSMSLHKPTTNTFSKKMFEMIYKVCMAKKSRLCDNAICASPKWLLEYDQKESFPRKAIDLEQTFGRAVRSPNLDIKRVLAIAYLYRLLYPKHVQNLWKHLPNATKQWRQLTSHWKMWCEPLMLTERVLALNDTSWTEIKVETHDDEDTYLQAYLWWNKVMTAPLDFSIRGWIKWSDYEDIVWDKHTFRGNGGNSLFTLLDRFPHVHPDLFPPDGPPIVRESGMAHFFDVGAYLPRQALMDPFQEEAKEFFVQVEQSKFKYHEDYIRHHLQLLPPKKRSLDTFMNHIGKKLKTDESTGE